MCVHARERAKDRDTLKITTTRAERITVSHWSPSKTAQNASLTLSRTSLGLTLRLPVATPVVTEAMIWQSVFISSTGHVSFALNVKWMVCEKLFQWWCNNTCEMTYMFYTLETLNYSRHSVAAAGKKLRRDVKHTRPLKHWSDPKIFCWHWVVSLIMFTCTPAL